MAPPYAAIWARTFLRGTPSRRSVSLILKAAFAGDTAPLCFPCEDRHARQEPVGGAIRGGHLSAGGGIPAARGIRRQS